MNSAPVLDAAAAPLPPTRTTPKMPDDGAKREPFGSLLADATNDDSDIDATGTTVKADDCVDDKEKKKDDSTTATAATVIPVVCFCPPPTIDPLPTPSCGKENVTEAVAKSQTPSTDAATAPATEKSPQPNTKSASTETLTELVSPKSTQTDQAAKAGKVQAAIQAAKQRSGGVELDPKLFQSILSEPTTAESQLGKAPQLQRPPVANASHGTLVAQLENRVKNSENRAEIAPGIEQKMPVREVLRRAVAEVSPVESFIADKQSNHVLNADFAAEARETIPVKSLEAAHLVESIRTEVASFRQRNDASVTVVLRPDSGTQLSLDLSIGRDGSVHALARCDRGDFHTLQAQWPQLQQSLAAHGIRIADLSNQNNAQQQNHRSPDAFQNFDPKQNQQQPRNDRESASFEEQFSASKAKLSQTKPQPQLASRATTSRRWQSWA